MANYTRGTKIAFPRTDLEEKPTEAQLLSLTSRGRTGGHGNQTLASPNEIVLKFLRMCWKANKKFPHPCPPSPIFPHLHAYSPWGCRAYVKCQMQKQYKSHFFFSFSCEVSLLTKQIWFADLESCRTDTLSEPWSALMNLLLGAQLGKHLERLCLVTVVKTWEN